MTHPYSILPSTAQAIQNTLTLRRQVAASQLRRLHYREGTPKGQAVRCSRHLKRLTDLGLIRRVKGVYDGVAEYVYMPPDIKSRPNAHTLDITELYVRLDTSLSAKMIDDSEPSTDTNDQTDNQAPDIIFHPEPWCHVQLHHMTLKPDAYLDMGDQRKAFIEMDRGTEYAAQLAKKMRQYLSAHEQWSEDEVFPLVLWVAHDIDRLRFLQSVIRRQVEPRLFGTVLFNNFVQYLTETE